MDTKGQELLKKYLAGNCTEQEKAILETWFITRQLDSGPELTEAERMEDMQEIRMLLLQEIGSGNKIRRIFVRIAVAASVLFCVGLGFYVYRINGYQKETGQELVNNFKPGGNKAVLTLSNGRQVLLTDAQNGQLATEGSTVINKTANGQVVYNAGGPGASVVVFNMMSTPRGGQYHLTLADGTNVWLNSASSIKYPTNFTGNERQVNITGEAYFEVAHDKSKPFKVVSAGQMVEVLGTHFNINTYLDEPAAKTTLLEGSVRISNIDHVTKILKPGQQATLQKNNIQISNADTEEAVAWKNGYFRFNDEHIESIMRKIGRWYNVDIQYEGNISREEYNGKISRFKNINQVLDILSTTKTVHFKIAGRRITVMN